LLLITETAKVEKILEYVVRGNMAQMSDSPKETLRDRPFVKELEAWIRFGYDEVVSKGDGLFSGSTGNPVIPRWLGMRLFDLFSLPKVRMTNTPNRSVALRVLRRLCLRRMIKSIGLNRAML